MFLARNLNPALRVDTSRTGALTRSDAFGVLGEPYRQQVWVMENTGEADYNALNLSLEKRYAHNWSGRISYSLSKATGTGNDQADKNTYQVGTELNLDKFDGPSNVDRRHILSLGAPDRDSEDRWDHGVQHRAVHERRAVHDLRQQHRRRSQRRAGRSGAGRHLQRHGARIR